MLVCTPKTGDWRYFEEGRWFHARRRGRRKRCLCAAAPGLGFLRSLMTRFCLPHDFAGSRWISSARGIGFASSGGARNSARSCRTKSPSRSLARPHRPTRRSPQGSSCLFFGAPRPQSGGVLGWRTWSMAFPCGSSPGAAARCDDLQSAPVRQARFQGRSAAGRAFRAVSDGAATAQQLGWAGDL